MKKVILFSIAIICITNQTHGQKFVFGIKSGLDILQAKYIERPDVIGLKLDSKLSYSIGLTSRLNINKFIQIQVEPRFIEKGYNITWGENDYDIYRNGYLSLPLLIRLLPIKKLYIEFGPDFSYLIYSKWRNSTGSFHDDNSPYKNSFELSALTGIGYKIFREINLGARYGYGITPYKDGKLFTDITYKIFNHFTEFYLEMTLFSTKKQLTE
jgi:hypothetical protein